MIVDLSGFSANATYHLMTQTIVPRPIAWVLTQNNDKITFNLAPFSYFTAVSSEPPVIMFSCSQKNNKGDSKDTVVNCLREECFVIHIAHINQLQTLQDSAQALDYGISEIDNLNLELCDFPKTNLKRIKDTPVALACSLFDTQEIGGNSQKLIFGEIKHIYIDDAIFNTENNRININAEALNPLGRLGLGQYSQQGTILKPTK